VHSELIVLTRAAEANNMYAMQRGAHPAPTRAALHHDVAQAASPKALPAPAQHIAARLRGRCCSRFGHRCAAACSRLQRPPEGCREPGDAGGRARCDGGALVGRGALLPGAVGEPRLQRLTGLEHRLRTRMHGTVAVRVSL